MDIAPDRTQLQNLSRKSSESFREYALRWRALAAQVDPPLTKREMNSMFLDTLPNSYYEKMVGLMTAEFADMITVGEKIDGGFKFGTMSDGVRGDSSSIKKPGFMRKNEGETNAVSFERRGEPKYQNQIPVQNFQAPQKFKTQAYSNSSNTEYQAQIQPKSLSQSKPRRQFDHIPMTYPEIYAYL